MTAPITTPNNNNHKIPDIAGTLDLTNVIGMRISVPFNTLDEMYTTMRMVGKVGWTSGDIPDGGLILPYKLRDTFDWSLIGAREFTMDIVEDGQSVKKQCISHRGLVYKRRDCPSRKIKGTTVPDMVKYSRGAKNFDGEDIKEGDDVKYVTIVTFRGNGPTIPSLEKRK